MVRLLLISFLLIKVIQIKGNMKIEDSSFGYYVGSSCEKPLNIRFNWQTAVEMESEYIDAFDGNGTKQCSWKKINGVYVDEF